MKRGVKTINFNFSKAMCHPQFPQILLDIQAEYEDGIDHKAVRWLSRGSTLKLFFSFPFFSEEGNLTALTDCQTSDRLAFLDDITQHHNVHNFDLQRKDTVVSQLLAHIKAFTTKLQLFQRDLS